MTFPAKFPQLNDTQLTEHARTVLIRVIRVAFPHARIPDGPYERTADIILKEAQASNWFRVALTQGLNSLDGLAGGDFCGLDDDDAYRVLKRIEGTDFFGFVRRTTVLNLYDDQEVWAVLGYEGRRSTRAATSTAASTIWTGCRSRGSRSTTDRRRSNRSGGHPAAPRATAASTPTPDSGENQGNLAATLSTQQDPREGARPGRSEPREGERLMTELRPQRRFRCRRHRVGRRRRHGGERTDPGRGATSCCWRPAGT